MVKDRLIQLLQTEGLSRNDFAVKLGVQRSNITHVLEGRNKPSFDFIEKLSTAFPQFNVDWLITGTGKMYKDVLMGDLFNPGKPFDQPADVSSTTNLPEELMHPNPHVSSSPQIETIASNKSALVSDKVKPDQSADLPVTNQQKNPSASNIITDIKVNQSDFPLADPQKKVERVLILYTDKSFDIYTN